VLSFVEQVFWAMRRSRHKTLADLTVGLLRRQQVGLAAIARGMLDDTTIRYRVKRIGRFLGNKAIQPLEVSRRLIEAMVPHDRESVIAVDWTDRGDYMVLKASLIFQKRALPLAWRHVWKWVYDKSQNDVEERFIFALAELVGDRPWVLLADRGFGRTELFRTLNEAAIPYVIRAKDNVWMHHEAFCGKVWDSPRKPNTRLLYRGVAWRKKHPVTVNLAVVHRGSAPAPWFLVTNLDRPAHKLGQLYAKRMGIEEGIRDCKSGLRLKGHWLSTPDRMDRMMVLVAVAMLLIALTASACLARGEDRQVTTHKRGTRSASYFTLGCRLLDPGPDDLCIDLAALYVA
jgi:hypothetical protein